MKNFKDIKTNSTYQVLVGTTGNFFLEETDLDFDIGNINIPTSSLLFGNSTIFCGNNISINNSGELNFTINSSLGGSHVSGTFDNISIKDNSLPISKLSTIDTNKLLSTDGPINVGDNLSIVAGQLTKSSGSFTINTGLPTSKNISAIIEDGIYFIDDSGFTNITLEPLLNRVYIINQKDINIYVGDIIIYPSEICLLSLDQKIKTNYAGLYIYDNTTLQNSSNYEYSSGDNIIQIIEKSGTENNPIIYLYTRNVDLIPEISGANNSDLVLNTNYTYTYNGTLERFEVSLIAGSNSAYFGTYESGGVNLTGNNSNTANGIYEIYVKEFNQTRKSVYKFSINTTKSIIIGDANINLVNPELVKTGNILDSIIAGAGVTIQSATINGSAYTLGSTITQPTYTLVLNSNGTYVLTLLKKSVGILPAIAFVGIDSNFVTDSGTRTFSMTPDFEEFLPELKLSNSSTTTNLNIFDHFNFYGSNFQITTGTLSNQSISGFGTVSLSANGNLTVIPTAFSTNSTTLNFLVGNNITINDISITLPLKLYFVGSNAATKFKIKINGCFSEIKYKDSVDAEYKTLDISNGVTSITRVDNESLGNQIQENGTFYDGNYHYGSDGEFLTIENELVDPPDNITQRSYTTTDTVNGYNVYIIEFSSSVELTELLISPAVNDNTFMPLPTSLTLSKSLDNGVTFLKINDYFISSANIPTEWYPYSVGDKLEALRLSGGFLRIIL